MVKTQTVPVVIGGYEDLTDPVPVVTTLEITPNPGESVCILRSTKTPAIEGIL